MKKIQLILIAFTVFLSIGGIHAQTPAEWKRMKGDLTFYMVNDNGRNGYYDQKPIAEMMGTMGETVKPECMVAVGDVHHFNGVVSVNDPLWLTNYELVYSHPELMLDWFPVLGNHEYRGNTQACLDYSQVSRRWVMPARYYTRVLEDNGVSVRIVMLDTPPMIEKYRRDRTTYPDAYKQDYKAQLVWLDSVLTNANEDWVVCFGHHPIYAETPKSQSERTDLQNRLLPVLKKHKNVAMYACGHIHNFQHIRMKDDPIDYVVNSSASLSRKVHPIEGTVFCSPESGFSVFSASKTALVMYMINKEGKILHTVTKNR
ncbi:metallophosphoesterase [Prevotella sp. KH2C16]|uniref:metallophosphoesterase n=1 Tax=Prevotella sp. KH2C16 TaxID=1855325 RepID=UPI0008E13B98|nr:metallophosphoesterase [Prevotella sp. KH2C16]SFG31205.1 Calcineurin-like phosphoesterase [Prevotella sp. KH2C16]